MTAPCVFAGNDTLETRPLDLHDMERTLGEALRDFASELRLADAADFAAFIRIGHMPNLRSIVRSAAELHYKPGTLDLAEPGELELGWLSPPLVTLPMILRHRGLRVYFRLRLAALFAAVEIEIDRCGIRNRRRSASRPARGARRGADRARGSAARLTENPAECFPVVIASAPRHEMTLRRGLCPSQ